MTNTHVNLSHLIKTYHPGTPPALNGVPASFERHKIHSIIGRSGAGKSTPFRCLNGLDQPDSGKILIENQNLLTLSRSQRRHVLKTIGTVFQKFNLLNRRKVLDNIILPLEWMGVSSSQAQKKALDLIEKVGLSGLENRYPSQLSGGQGQRVSIARALITDANLLLCDEFTSALDPETSLDILGLLGYLNKTLGVTIILITHDMSVVREVSDFVYVMDKGEIVERGAFQDILIHPQHATTKSLLRGELLKELPPQIEEQLHPTPHTPSDQLLLRLIFFGEATQRPVIAELITSHKIPVNILAGGFNHVRGMIFGSLLISIPQDAHHQQKALEHFAHHGVTVDLIGYLTPTLLQNLDSSSKKP